MKNQFFRWILLLSILVSASAYAQEDSGDFDNGIGGSPGNETSEFVSGLHMGLPTTGGSGCPNGTVSAILSPDQKTLSLLFDNYVVQAGRSKSLRQDVKSCTIAIPFYIPDGYQVSVTKLDYRGFHSIPAQGRTRYQAVYGFTDLETGRRYPQKFRRQIQFHGPLEDNYVINSQIRRMPLWSRCGGDFAMDVETEVTAVSNPQGDDVMATVDSIDARSSDNVEYHLMWRKCETRKIPSNDPRDRDRERGGGRGNQPPFPPGRGGPGGGRPPRIG